MVRGKTDLLKVQAVQEGGNTPRRKRRNWIWLRPPEATEVEIRENGDVREIESNGMPDHLVGRFPNRDNPNEIREQAYDVGIPLLPEEAEEITYLHGPQADRRFRVFGITITTVS